MVMIRMVDVILVRSQAMMWQIMLPAPVACLPLDRERQLLLAQRPTRLDMCFLCLRPLRKQ